MTGTRYVHGTSAREQERLELMNGLINPGCLRALALEGERRVLDIGCGTALMARTIARALGSDARVVGVERSEEQLATARRSAAEAGEADLVELRAGDAVDLPLAEDERGSFDLVHARFLLEHHPEPLAVVRAAVRAARPGGRIVLFDDDHDVLRTSPPTPAFAAAWEAYWRSYEDVGCDPLVGRHLVSLLVGAGASPQRNELVFYGGCAGDGRLRPLALNLCEVLRGAREQTLAGRRLPAADYDAGVEELERWSLLPDAALWFPICMAEGVRPA
jgi:SAM-dependent methyltransferase